MKVVQVPGGLDAPDGADYVRVDRLPSGNFQYASSVAQSHPGVTFSSAGFPNKQTALDEGIRRAEAQGAEVIYIIDAERSPEPALPPIPREQMTDTELASAYQRTTGEPDNIVAEWLLDEIERRGLDV